MAQVLRELGVLGLDDTIAQRLAGMPAAWSAVTVRQMLNHSAGLALFRAVCALLAK